MVKKDNKYYNEIEQQFLSKEPQAVLQALGDVRKRGHAYLLPLLFNLIKINSNQQVQEEVFQILGQVKEKDCVNYLIEEIQSGNSQKHITKLIATCWQSGLDYGQHILVFAEQFIKEDFETSIEAFTVMEEWIHESPKELVKETKQFLIEGISEISDEKKPLYHELVKMVDEFL